MSFSTVVKSISLICLTISLSFAQGTSSGEKFLGSSTCNITTTAPLPVIASAAYDKDAKTITVNLTGATNSSDLYYALLLTTDLTILLDEAASMANNGKGRFVCIQKNSVSDDKLSAVLSASVINEQYYVAVASYHCNWNARDNNGKLLRSGWRLWNDGGVPRTITTASSLDRENLFVKGYAMPGDNKLLYIRASVETPADKEIRFYSGTVESADPDAKFAFGSTVTTKRVNATTVYEAITKMASGIDTIVFQQNSTGPYHLFIKNPDATIKRLEVGLNDKSGVIRKADISYQTYDLFNQFVDGVSEYAYLVPKGDETSITDPVTQGEVTTPPPLEAKMLCAAMAQLTVGHASGITDAGFVVSKTVNGYSQIFDDIVMNWSIYSGVTDYARLALVESRARTVINAGTVPLKERLTLVNRGTITTAAPSNDAATKSDTDCVAFFEGYSKVFLQIDLPTYTTGQFTATGIKLSIPSNLTLFTYDPSKSEFTTLLDGGTNSSTVLQTNTDIFKLVIDNGLWCKGKRPALGTEITEYEFYINIAPVNIVHGCVIQQLPKAGLAKSASFPITLPVNTPSGFIKDKISDIFNSFLVDNNGNVSTNVTNYSNLMLPGQKRKCVFNEKAKLAKNNTITISCTAPSNTIKTVNSGAGSITIEAVKACAYEAVVVQAVEKDVNGKVCRAFEKKFTIFQFGPITTGTIAQAGDDGTVDVTLHPANLVPVELTTNARVLVQTGANCVLYNNKNEQLLPIDDFQVVSGIYYETLLWSDYVAKFLEPANPSNKCKLKVNKGSTGYLKMIFLPAGELGDHLTNNSEGLPLYMVVFPVDNLYVPVTENEEIPVTAYLVTGDGTKWDSPDVSASVAWDPKSLGPQPIPGGILSETPVTKDGYSEILFPVVKNFASGNPSYQVDAEVSKFTVGGKNVSIGTVKATSGIIQFIPGEPAKVVFNGCNLHFRHPIC